MQKGPVACTVILGDILPLRDCERGLPLPPDSTESVPNDTLFFSLLPVELTGELASLAILENRLNRALGDPLLTLLDTKELLSFGEATELIEPRLGNLGGIPEPGGQGPEGPAEELQEDIVLLY